jgi:hypothetical protein
LTGKSISITWSKPDPTPAAKSTSETIPKEAVLIEENKNENGNKELAPTGTTNTPTAEAKRVDEPEKKSAIMDPTKSSIRDIINSVSNDDNTNSESNDSLKNENDENSNGNAGNNNENYFNEDENNDVFDSLFGTNEEK